MQSLTGVLNFCKKWTTKTFPLHSGRGTRTRVFVLVTRPRETRTSVKRMIRQPGAHGRTHGREAKKRSGLHASAPGSSQFNRGRTSAVLPASLPNSNRLQQSDGGRACSSPEVVGGQLCGSARHCIDPGTTLYPPGIQRFPSRAARSVGFAVTHGAAATWHGGCTRGDVQGHKVARPSCSAKRGRGCHVQPAGTDRHRL